METLHHGTEGIVGEGFGAGVDRGRIGVGIVWDRAPMPPLVPKDDGFGAVGFHYGPLWLWVMVF